jgi:Holliday junction resolvasome RuvABC ATP-dependent DNA helicase subunit
LKAGNTTNNTVCDDDDESTNNKPTEVIVKEESFDLEGVIEYTGSNGMSEKIDFRPQNFHEFIGQELAKKRIDRTLKRIRSGMKTHIFLDAIRGHGKSTMARIIAKELNADLIEITGTMIADKETIKNIINQITLNPKLTVLFVDELDSLDRKYFKFLNPILEEFKIGHKRIKPFVFIGASILKHELLNKCPDTMDRIDTQIKFERYTSDDIAVILEQYKNHLFNEKKVDHEVYKVIGKNCKYNPRVAIALLKDYIVTPDIGEVLHDARIVYNGLTDIDVKILETLAQNKSMGASSLAQSVGISEKEYMIEFEPYLVEFGYVVRGRGGRKITEYGSETLSNIRRI